MPSFSPKISLIFLAVLLIVVASGTISIGLSLLLGIAYALVLGNPVQPKTQWASAIVLKTSIVLLGFGLNITEIASTALDGFWVTVITIALALTAGWILGRILKVESKLSFLISSGTAICGGSAIAAVAPAIRAAPSDIIISISIVFLLNSAALLIYPQLGHQLNLSQAEFGLWSALGIHDTSSVVGAAASYGDESLKVATTTKLARSLWIIPLVFVGGFLFKHPQSRFKFPLFILLFIGASVLTTLLKIPQATTSVLSNFAKAGMAVSLFLIGAGFSRETFSALRWNSLWQGVVLWIILSISSLVLVKGTLAF